MSSSGVTDFCPESPTLHAMSGKFEAFFDKINPSVLLLFVWVC